MSLLKHLSLVQPTAASQTKTHPTLETLGIPDAALHSAPNRLPEDADGLVADRAPAVTAASPPIQPAAICFEEIVEKYHAKVFQLIYRYTGDYEESSDLTQDTFVRAYGAWNEFRGESQIYTWLYRIAINLCHNQQKKLQRRRRVESVSLDAALPEDQGESWTPIQVADEGPLPLQLLESAELREKLQEALRSLPDNYRTVVVLRDIEGLTYEEIARVTDSTLEAIKSRLFRARNAVRRLMLPYLSGSSLDQSCVASSTGGSNSSGSRSTVREHRFQV